MFHLNTIYLFLHLEFFSRSVRKSFFSALSILVLEVKVLEVLVTEALVLAVWNQQVSGGFTARSKLSPRTKETRLPRSSMRQGQGSPHSFLVVFLNAKYFSRVKSLEPL